ncbi:hypothetical protein Ccrd_010080 [Cynara cardunculus var. scolymus]|uniref:Uncharacterized protein n=1 Tax=Cynara cardunculus var. scolymus TaxID=59895 RepID=A0A103YLS6_CYNCS|nr:hypothetical protein Ccrd_010080 [Cynara cardunculus var. scolymus]
MFTIFSSFSMSSLALPGIVMYPNFVISLSVDKVEVFYLNNFVDRFLKEKTPTIFKSWLANEKN